MNKKEIKRELKKELNFRIEKKILNSLFDNLINYEGTTKEKLKGCFSDWLHGCKSGIISEVIYYTNTTKIFNYYKKEIITIINDLLKNEYFKIYKDINAFNIEDTTYLLNYKGELQEKQFDKYQKNNLVWFIYDYTISNLYNNFTLL